MSESENAHNNYAVFIDEATLALTDAKFIVLATSASNKVTSRTMSHINDGLTIMFQTGRNSEKALQMKANPNIAFTLNNMQIEAIAEIAGPPVENRLFIDKYKQKFPDSYAAYTHLPDEILVIALPTKITFYKYDDGRPFRHACLIKDKKVFMECVL